MHLFHNLFAAYYNILIKFRKNKLFRRLNRGGTEDFGALCFLAASQVYFLFLLTLAIKFTFNINTSNLSDTTRQMLKIGIFFTGVILFYMENKYFLTNRAKRPQILIDFDNLNDLSRKLWFNIAIVIMLFPLWGLIIMIIYRSFQ